MIGLLGFKSQGVIKSAAFSVENIFLEFDNNICRSVPVSFFNANGIRFVDAIAAVFNIDFK
ncbi:hypothetical protein DERF_010722 [Dermatophagoides farinae]|uniref:Uncharacterized protein n=1 Tax=Dermatophagoides farinae TaxID=6954 RepID=A0A922L433_DERFA|nr:hypothetical protein DERF_010722 [Dermatophagoides farinae]